MKKIKFPKLGQPIKLISSRYNLKRAIKKNFEGTVVFKNRYYFVVDLGNYKESFLITDFYTGDNVLL